MKTKTKLPKWFLDGDPMLYKEGAEVQNPFSGDCYTLNGDELSMYDYLIGLQFTIDKNGGAFNPKTFPYQRDLAKGLAWFRQNNAKAYMVLLD
jgi:hypothetical protein